MLRGEQLHALGVAHRRNTDATPLVAAEDIREPAGAFAHELHLLRALREVDGEPLVFLPRPAGREPRGLRVHRVRRMDAYQRFYTLRQVFFQFVGLMPTINSTASSGEPIS